MFKATFFSLFILYIFLNIILKNVYSLPSSGGVIQSKALKVQLNSSRTVTVNKTATLKILSVKKQKIDSGSVSHGSRSSQSCFSHDINPYSFTNSEIEFIHELVVGITYIPMGSTNYYSLLAESLIGQPLSVVDIEHLCLNRAWNFKKHEIDIFGLQSVALIECNIDTYDMIRPIVCKTKGAPGESYKVFPTLTDGVDYELVVGCFANGEKFWYVISDQTTLDRHDKNEIIKKVKELGFDIGKTLEPSYEDCNHISHHKPKYEIRNTNWDYDESYEHEHDSSSSESKESKEEDYEIIPHHDEHYISIPRPSFENCIKSTLSEDEHNFAKELCSENFYIPMASHDYYNGMSLLLTGNDFESNDEDEACFIRKPGHIKNEFFMYGYNNKAIFNCEHRDFDEYTSIHCKNKGFHTETSIISPILTDGENFVLIIGCLEKGTIYWFVASRQNHLDEYSKRLILKELEHHGLSNQVNELSYEECDDHNKNKNKFELSDWSSEEMTSHSSKGCFNSASSLTEQDLKFVDMFSKHNAFIPMGSPNFYDTMSHILIGDGLEEHGVEKACIHRYWNKDYGELILGGFGDKIILQCNVISRGLEQRMSCKSNEITPFCIEVLPVYTDRKNFVLSVGCLSPHEKFWFIVSNRKYVDNIEKKLIHKKIASLGFTTEAIQLKYHHCEAPDIAEEIESSEEFGSDEDGHCIKHSSILSEENEIFIKHLFEQETYTPYGNRLYYNSIVHLLTGKSLEDIDRSKICLTRTWSSDFTQLTFHGLEHTISLKCNHPSEGQIIHCSSLDSKIFGKFIPVYTDNINFVLIVGCVPDGQKFWFVVSLHKHIDDFSKHAVHIKLASLGFPVHAITLNYHNCGVKPDSSEESDEDEQCFIGPPSLSSSEKTFINQIYHQKTYMPYGNTVYYNSASHLLTGKSLVDNDSDKLCLFRTFNPDLTELQFHGFKRTASVKCHRPENGQIIHCASLRSKISGRFVPIYTDTQNFVLNVGCLPNGQKLWFVSSLKTHIDTSAKNVIHRKLSSLGFPVHAITMSYHNCGGHEDASKEIESSEENVHPNKKNSQEEEEECSELLRTKSSFTEKEMGFMIKLVPEHLYIPMANPNYYDAMSHILSDKILEKQHLNKACIRRRFDLKHFKGSFISGFGSEAAFDCKPELYGSSRGAICFNKKNSKFTVRLAPVLTDGKNYILAVGCISNREKIWFIESCEDHLNNIAKKEIFHKLITLGFSPHDRIELNYKHCLKKDSDESSELKSHKSDESKSSEENPEGHLSVKRSITHSFNFL